MGIIVKGKYYADRDKAPKLNQTSALTAGIHRQHKIDRDTETYAEHLIQPYNPDGSINETFVEYYGDNTEQGKYLKEKLCQSNDKTN